MTDQTESDHCKHGTPRDPNWVCAQCGNDALTLAAGDAYSAIGATVTQTENAELLTELDVFVSHGVRIPGEMFDRVAAAIRALEAKVRVEARRGDMWQEAEFAIRADRDRLAGEVARMVALDLACQEQHDLMEAEVARLTSDLDNCKQTLGVALTRAENAETDRDFYASELAAARENEARLLFLVNHGSDTLDGESVRDWIEKRRLRMGGLLAAIDAARRAGEGEA